MYPSYSMRDVLTFVEVNVTFKTKIKGLYIMQNILDIGHLSKEEVAALEKFPSLTPDEVKKEYGIAI